jgi:hypothetical protein
MTTSQPTNTTDFLDTIEWLRPGWEPAWLANFADKATRTPSSKCEDGDLTHPVALVLQAVLGFMAFSVLLLKRQCEPADSRRNWMVWFLDTNKQGIAMVAMHFMNIFLAESGEKAKASDPCTYYLFSFALDSSVGLIIIWIGLKGSEWLIQRWQIMGGHNLGDYDMSEKWSFKGPRPKSNTNCNNNVGGRDLEANSIVMSCDDDTMSQTSANLIEINQNAQIQQNSGFQQNSGLQNPDFSKNSKKYKASFVNSLSTSSNQNNNNANNLSIIGGRTGSHTRCLPKMPFSLSIWSLQTFAYLLVTVIEKVVVFKLLAIDSLEVVFHDLRILMTAWFKNKYIEILIVLFIIPLILNIFMFWVVDNILMQSQGCLHVIFDWLKKLPKLIFCGSVICCTQVWQKRPGNKKKNKGGARDDDLAEDEENVPVLARNANTNRNNNCSHSETICDITSPIFTNRVKRISQSIDTACDSVRNLMESALSSQSEQHTRLPNEMETEEVTFEANTPQNV